MFDFLLNLHTEHKQSHAWLVPFVEFMRRLSTTPIRYAYNSKTSHWACCFSPSNLSCDDVEPLVVLEPVPDESGVRVAIQ